MDGSLNRYRQFITTAVSPDEFQRLSKLLTNKRIDNLYREFSLDIVLVAVRFLEEKERYEDCARIMTLINRQEDISGLTLPRQIEDWPKYFEKL